MSIFFSIVCASLTLILTNIGIISHKNKYIQSYKNYHVIKNKVEYESSYLLFFSSLTIFLLLNYKGYSVIFSILVTCTTLSTIYVDYLYRVIPDIFSLGMVWGALLLNSLIPFLDLSTQIYDIIAIYITMNLLNYILEKYTEKFGIGRGDIKFITGIGACAGVLNCLIILNLAVIARLLFKTSNPAFGPFIGISYLSVLVFI